MLDLIYVCNHNKYVCLMIFHCTKRLIYHVPRFLKLKKAHLCCLFVWYIYIFFSCVFVGNSIVFTRFLLEIMWFVLLLLIYFIHLAKYNFEAFLSWKIWRELPTANRETLASFNWDYHSNGKCVNFSLRFLRYCLIFCLLSAK